MTHEIRGVSRRTVAAAAALVLAAGIAAYWNALSNGVTNFDDIWQVTSNPLVNPPVTWHKLARIAFFSYHGEYQPVKLLSYLADHIVCRALGVDVTFGLHLSNVILHVANSIVVMLIAVAAVEDFGGTELRDKGALFVGAFAGVCFALHPVHVESVAWLSGRKDVLSFFFMAVSFLVFRRLTLGQRRPAGLLAVVLFALALASKATVLCFPLLVIAYWLLVSFRGGWGAAGTLAGFVLTAAFFIAVGVYVVVSQGYRAGPIGGSYYLHLLTALKAFPFYMRTMLFPADLCAVYRVTPAAGLWDGAVWWGAAMLALQIAVVLFVPVRMVRFIVSWYLLSLVPVLQILPMPVPSPVADRYAYIPSVPFALAPALLLWQVRTALLRRRATAVAAVLVAAAVFYAGVLGVATWSRNRVWQSSETLWKDVLAKNPRDRFALVNLGQHYLQAGEFPAARRFFNEAAGVDPAFVMAYVNLGQSYEMVGNLAAARGFYNLALEHESSLTGRATVENHARAIYGLARLCLQERKYLSARRLAERAQTLFPELDGTYGLYVRADAAIKESRALADGLISTGDLLADTDVEKAAEVYRKAAEAALEYSAPYVSLGRLYARHGRNQEAYEAFSQAAALGKTGADFEYDYGVAALATGNYNIAAGRLTAALALDPSMDKAQVKLAVARAYRGEPAQALEMLTAVLRKDPSNAEARENYEAIIAFIEGRLRELPNAGR